MVATTAHHGLLQHQPQTVRAGVTSGSNGERWLATEEAWRWFILPIPNVVLVGRDIVVVFSDVVKCVSNYVGFSNAT